MKGLKVVSLLLLGIVLLAPVSWGAESDASAKTEDLVVSEENKTDAAKAADPQHTDQVPGAEGGKGQKENADAGKDPDDEPVTQTDLQGLRTELETLRDQFQRNYDKKTAVTTRSLKFGGTASVRYIGPTKDSDKNSFSLNSIILKFSGNLRKDYEEGKNIDYVIGVNTGSDLKLKAQDAYLSYSILRSNDVTKPYLYVYIGQQKKWFGLEATASEEYKPTIRGAQFATGLSVDERDIGVVLNGDLFPHNDYGFNKYRVPAIAYQLGIVNGSGPNTLDENNDKDYFGRIAFNAPVDYNHPLRGLTLGFSGYLGTKTATATRTTKTTKTVLLSPSGTATITTDNKTSTIDQRGSKNRWGADLSYVNTPVGFTLEYAAGTTASLSNETVTNGATTTPSAFRHIRSEGYTATVFYNFGEQFQKSFKDQTRVDDWYPLTYQPFFRFDRYDPDLDTPDDRIDIYTIGFNWYFAETTKLQLNYNIKAGQIPSDQKTKEFLAQFQFGF